MPASGPVWRLMRRAAQDQTDGHRGQWNMVEIMPLHPHSRFQELALEKPLNRCIAGRLRRGAGGLGGGCSAARRGRAEGCVSLGLRGLGGLRAAARPGCVRQPTAAVALLVARCGANCANATALCKTPARCPKRLQRRGNLPGYVRHAPAQRLAAQRNRQISHIKRTAHEQRPHRRAALARVDPQPRRRS